jgi:hypothetical protein
VLKASLADSICPDICTAEGCDHIVHMEKDQDEGYCEVCGGNTITSALVLAEAI